jgi:hypothetical protein
MEAEQSPAEHNISLDQPPGFIGASRLNYRIRVIICLSRITRTPDYSSCRDKPTRLRSRDSAPIKIVLAAAN